MQDGRPARYVRANRLVGYQTVENGDWKLLIWDQTSNRPRMPQGTIGFRWANQDPGKWNLEPKDGLDGEQLDPQLSFHEQSDDFVQLEFDDFSAGQPVHRAVPIRKIETKNGRITVTTVFDLIMAQFGVPRRLPGDYPAAMTKMLLIRPPGKKNTAGSIAIRCCDLPGSGAATPKKPTART